ncbi:putative ankyrin repeat protein [Trichoderma austrokoningii]
MGGFDDLPTEVFEQIIGNVAKPRDLSSLSRCNRGLYWAISDTLFTRTFEKRVASKDVDHAVSHVFTHAVKHDSQHLIQWLMFRQHGARLRGPFPLMERFTFLHYALLQDAPKVAIQLLKHGSDLDEDDVLYPDLKSLYVSVARPLSNSLGALDGALRIACSYALPRMAEYLLIRGADPNTYSDFGLAATHIAAQKRVPWSQFKMFAWFEGDRDAESVLWNAKVARTAEVLLRFGADSDLPMRSYRSHQCGPKCWKSLACLPMEQRVLHVAAAGGSLSVVKMLIREKVSFFQADGEGNLPLFHAMAQGHDDIVVFLLEKMKRVHQRRRRSTNAIICKSTNSTVLHVACRFGYFDVVSAVIKEGADVEMEDSLGRRPIHEALGQCASGMEDRIVETLYLLSENDADPDVVDCSGKKARELGEKHIFSGVRALFEYATMARYEWWRLTESRQPERPAIVGKSLDGVRAQPQPSSKGEMPKKRAKAATKTPVWVQQETFPKLKPSSKAPQMHKKNANPTAIVGSAWGPRNTAKSVEVVVETEVEKSVSKKGGRKKKWTSVSL